MALRFRGWLVLAGVAVVAVTCVSMTLRAMSAGRPTISTSTVAGYQPVAQGHVGRLPPFDWTEGPQESDSPALRAPSDYPGPSTAFGPAYANCRFGVGVALNPIDVYTDAPKLRIGWYYDWRTNADPPTPGGMEYVQTIRLSQPKDVWGGYLPTYTVVPPLTDPGLGARIDASPGALWMVGNEPDRVLVQDDMLPDQYAIAYHDVYHFIKERDPSARIAIAGVIQPTPLRLQYLDMILDHYQDAYGTPMPVDVWNIHVYIIQEVAGEWGAKIPPGISATTGIVYPIGAHGNVTVFGTLVEYFRAWMDQRGQRNKPLIISEMGVLMPQWWQKEFDEARVIDFMNGSFDYLLSMTDPDTGYPADNNHLVQQWNWFSLDDDSVDAEGYLNWNGMLFNSITRTPTVFGGAFSSYTAQISPTVDLVAFDLTGQSAGTNGAPGPTTLTLEALVANAGNIPFTDTVEVRFYEITGTGSVEIGSSQVVTDLIGCAMGQQRATLVWPSVAPGIHQVRVVLDPSGLVSEQDRLNNTFEGTVLIPTKHVFLPVVRKSR